MRMARSTAVATKQNTSLASIQEEMQKELDDIQNRLGAGTRNIISTRGKVFNLPDGSQHEGPLEMVVVDFLSWNKYYEHGFDPDAPEAPACFAYGTAKNESLTPSDNSASKQSASCEACPMNQFGSAGKGKACKNTRLLALLSPEATEDFPILLLSVSPMGLKNFDGFVNAASLKYKTLPIGVVARIGLDQKATYPLLTFQIAEPNQNIAVHWARREEARRLLTVEPQYSTSAEEEVKPKSNGRRRRK
jgi:hypothetical protein